MENSKIDRPKDDKTILSVPQYITELRFEEFPSGWSANVLVSSKRGKKRERKLTIGDDAKAQLT